MTQDIDDAGKAGSRSCRAHDEFGLYSKIMGNWSDFIYRIIALLKDNLPIVSI